jgi:hypothetical protein
MAMFLNCAVYAEKRLTLAKLSDAATDNSGHCGAHAQTICSAE